MTPLAFMRYKHTLRSAYRIRGLEGDSLEQTFCSEDILRLPTVDQVVDEILPTIRARLDKVGPGLSKTLLSKSMIRTVELKGQKVYWPLINQQGAEWYKESPMHCFDFLNEDSLGLHRDARTIYDFGGHHGVWAQYYSMVVGNSGHVYTFEPSILNIEVSCLLLLINNVTNVINVAAAIGAGGSRSEAPSNMLVDFVDASSIEVVNLRDVTWEYADFLKMDVEGFEYDIITACPWIFDLARNMHIEVHIPHLENRGLDYRQIIKLIPFDKFEVFNHSEDYPVHADTKLEGFCGLLLRRRG